MLRRLSWKKFLLFSRPFINDLAKDINRSNYEIKWHDNSEVIGMSADKPERIEGIKASWIWLDEIFQMSEQFYLECQARVADTQGYLICTGSLGTQYVNPKLHWAYNYFKINPDKSVACFEWATSKNPYFPKDEIERLKETLDPQTFRQMFEINWDTIPSNAVFHEFSEDNISNLIYNPKLLTFVCVDWGWAHPMAAGFFQYDRQKDIVYLIDEIFGSKITIEGLYKKLMQKSYRIDGYFCDISGNQEREQTGRSNVQWFAEKNINFDYRSTAVTYGIPIVRRYIKDGKSRRKFIVNASCKHSIDGMKQYRYKEVNGIIQNENPLKENDDCVDMIRYFFVNYIDDLKRDKVGVQLIPR